jgi:hypothetical protein
MKTKATKQTAAESTFNARAAAWQSLSHYNRETRDADSFCGGLEIISTFEKGVFRCLTLTRAGGYAKKTSLRGFGMVDGSKCGLREADFTLSARR